MESQQRLRVLFLCAGNSARSQMAEAILRQMSHNKIEVSSAGSAPEQEIHPAAVVGDAEAQQRAFDRTASLLVNRIRIWLSLPAIGGTSRPG